MRNLNIWDLSLQDLKVNSSDELIVCNGYNESSSSSEVYICTHNLSVINFDENGAIKWTKDISDLASPNNKPISITFLTLTNSLCVGLANGELITISDNGTACDLTGVCDSGLLAIEWSPDQEFLALVTKDLKMVLMNMFDPINEVKLLNEDFGEKQFITVGWGKKETQFQGRAGKQAAKVKNEVIADPESQTDDTVKITWRGDGNLFSVGFTMDGIRRFKVFDKEGHLQYTSEKQQGLESNLSWRPSGNVIATTQKINDKYFVSFFEKNGLKHGEIDLPVNSNTTVEDITWSTDSEILTLQCRDTVLNVQSLLLYTTGNYHWYLKQTLLFNSEQKISKIMWDNDFDITNNKKLHVFLQNGQHFSYNWTWNVDHSRGNVVDDDAVVGVIDGDKILLTGFRQTVVPPPMAAIEIKFDTNITSVHFAPNVQQQDLNTNCFFVSTTDSKLLFYKQINKFPLQYELFKTIEVEKYEFPYQYCNWFWVKHDTIVCVKVVNDDTYYLVEYKIQLGKLEKVNDMTLPAVVSKIVPHPSNALILFLQLNNGDIFEYNLGETGDICDVSFGVHCPKFNAFSIENEINFIGLSHKGNLFINDTMIMNNISSYFLHTHFLLITTLQHVLLCVELTKSGLDAITKYQTNESEHVYKRKIERGAKLVIAVPNDTRTVFQMPRGNLETIQPRPLSLKIIGEYLDQLQYHKAFDIMRKQRINLNLIYDHNPESFVKHIDVFLESIENNSWLNLFLSDLENQDVSKTMYSSSYVSKIDKPKSETESKIQRICDLVREYLNKRSDSDNKILPLLTTYVKKSTIQDLEEALLKVKELKIKESGGSKLPVGSDEALKYLLYMVDVNQLFDVALGMYDFELVLLVANKSQKDPKEYVQMLDELNEMEENYKRFTINKHLKRFDKAVESLVLCGSSRHNELKTFVKYHSLYREALALLPLQDEIFQQISDDFGLYLKLKKHYVEAGIIFEKANSIDKAIECYKDALEWELAISLAHTWPEQQLKDLCWDLVQGLKQEKRHKEALQILEQFYGNCDETIAYAIECGHYKMALQLCSRYNKNNVKEEKVLPAILEEYKNMKDLIETNYATFVKHRERLHVVRENKTKHPVDTYEFYTNKDSDLYSDAGSTIASSSRGSSRSFRSSKNRRKHERKVASLKEGSQYEDVALVMALHNLVTCAYELRLPMKELVTALSYFNKNKEACILQESLEKVLKEMKESFKQIWTNELVLEATNATIAAQNVPEGQSIIPQGIATLEPHLRIAPVISNISWKLEGLN